MKYGGYFGLRPSSPLDTAPEWENAHPPSASVPLVIYSTRFSSDELLRYQVSNLDYFVQSKACCLITPYLNSHHIHPNRNKGAM